MERLHAHAALTAGALPACAGTVASSGSATPLVSHPIAWCSELHKTGVLGKHRSKTGAVASATLEAEKVAAFFDAATVRRRGAAPLPGVDRSPALLSVEGRTHSVQVRPRLIRNVPICSTQLHAETMPLRLLAPMAGRLS